MMPSFLSPRFCLFALLLAPSAVALNGAANAPDALTVQKTGAQLRINVEVDPTIQEVELRIRSDRNRRISFFREVSPNNPTPEEQRKIYGDYDRDILYPVVDIELQRGMEGVGDFGDGAAGTYILNGPFWKEETPIAPTVRFPAGHLYPWENSLRVKPRSQTLQDFYLALPCPVVAGRVERTIGLLSDQWSGDISLHAMRDGADTALGQARIEPAVAPATPFARGDDLGPERLLEGLRASIGFTLRSQIHDPQHPANGGLFLFYDLDAATYRSPHWVWGWGPSVAMLLRAADSLPDVYEPETLRQAADAIGRASLRFIWNHPGSPVDGQVISRWDRNLRWDEGYAGAVTAGDSLFLSGWAWIPLYQLTKNEAYLRAARRQCESAEALLQDWIIPPHSYYFESGAWSDWVIDETGFGVEGFAELYALTGDEAVREGGKRYIDRHIKLLGRDDGLWSRTYVYSTKTVYPSGHMTRGLAWAIEGLLAAHRMMPEGGYLEQAQRMADVLLPYQKEDGHWNFRYNQSVAEVGISEKGTAAWSYFMYQLYRYTGDEKYLVSARSALRWCLNALYDGPDAEARGSIVGVSPQSGVGYRRWFSVACTYTSAFFGLAILEEMQLAAPPAP